MLARHLHEAARRGGSPGFSAIPLAYSSARLNCAARDLADVQLWLRFNPGEAM